MSEYKENTVGWWLSQLKEPLKSRALDALRDNPSPSSQSTPEAMWEAMYGFIHALSGDIMFWDGVVAFFHGRKRQEGHEDEQTRSFNQGWDLAKDCAPKGGGEDKAIVDSPKKTRELFFYGGNIINPFKEPLTISPSGEMLSVIVEEDKIKELMNANPSVTFWPTNVGGVSPEKPESWMDGEIRKYRERTPPEIPVTGAMIEDFGKRVKWPITREIEAPERAVVGYEIPKPIDTIEKKHELRIKNLEARVMQQQVDLDATVETLRKTIDLLHKTMVKVTTLEFINDQKK